MAYSKKWERLHNALVRLMANGIGEDAAKSNLCDAISDQEIRIRVCIESGFGPNFEFMHGKVRDGSHVEIPTDLKPADLDWKNSCPLKPWKAKLPVSVALDWQLRWIDVLKHDVTKVLLSDLHDTEGQDRDQQARQRGEKPIRPPVHGGQKRGPKPIKLNRVIDAMMRDIREKTLTAVSLQDMREKELASRYGVTRDTARKARNSVLSKFPDNSNSDK